VAGSHPNWLDREFAKPSKYCKTVLFEFSERSSVSGWNAKDISSLVCRILATSLQ
jgi:hypothetical protein